MKAEPPKRFSFLCSSAVKRITTEVQFVWGLPRRLITPPRKLGCACEASCDKPFRRFLQWPLSKNRSSSNRWSKSARLTYLRDRLCRRRRNYHSKRKWRFCQVLWIWFWVPFCWSFRLSPSLFCWINYIKKISKSKVEDMKKGTLLEQRPFLKNCAEMQSSGSATYKCGSVRTPTSTPVMSHLSFNEVKGLTELNPNSSTNQ